MKRRLFTIGATSVYAQPALLLTIIYAIWTGSGAAVMYGFVSIMLHEATHALTAAVFGKPPTEIELTPMGALMRLEDDASMPFVPRLLTVAAGPGMTLLLGGLSIWATKHGWLSPDTGRLFFTTNAALLLLNLLPALPLDGGRLVSLLTSLFLRQEAVCRLMRVSGYILGIGCVVLNLWQNLHLGGWNLSLSAVGCFLIYSAHQATMTQTMAQLRMLMDRKIRLENRGFLRCQWIALTDQITFQQALASLHPTRHTMFCVTETGSQRHLGNLSEQEIIAACMQSPYERVADRFR